MTFFNKKEEILEIKLTSYGKYLLSRGDFKPMYYKFFDDDVVYDSEFYGFTESSGDAEARIQENSPSLRVQTSFRDLEKEVIKIHPFPLLNTKKIGDFEHVLHGDNLFEEKYNSFSAALPLGSSDLGSQKLPYWNVIELKNGFGDITHVSTTDSASSPVINIPSIQSDITASMRIKTADFCGPIEPKTNKYIHVYDDKTYVSIDDDFILLRVEEENVPFINEGFSVEVFEVTQSVDNERILIPKKFKKEIEYVRNGILLDEEEINEQLRNNSLEVDSNYVSYWFDIRVDQYIDNKTRCEYILSLEKKNSVFDSNIECQDYSQDPGSSLYPPEDFEPEECE